MRYGYARVSSKDQNEERQLIALSEYGAERIYCDKQSGKDCDRPEYRKLIRRLKPEDVFIVKSIDRLGRNYSEILEQWRVISKEKKAHIIVIDMPLLDTDKNNDLTGTLIADIVLQLLSYVAQTEREFIKQRQAEGIAAAKLRGVKFGRTPIGRPPSYEGLKELYLAGGVTSRAAASQLGISHTCFLRWVREDSEKDN